MQVCCSCRLERITRRNCAVVLVTSRYSSESVATPRGAIATLHGDATRQIGATKIQKIKNKAGSKRRYRVFFCSSLVCRNAGSYKIQQGVAVILPARPFPFPPFDLRGVFFSFSFARVYTLNYIVSLRPGSDVAPAPVSRVMHARSLNVITSTFLFFL